MRRTKANRALTFVMAAALLIGSIHGVGAKEQSKAYEAPELTLVQGASDYDLTEGITYDSEKYTLSVTDTGNFDINVAGDYEISYALTEKESSVSETESVENTESADIIESTETVSGTETVDTTETIENTDQTPEGDDQTSGTDTADPSDQIPSQYPSQSAATGRRFRAPGIPGAPRRNRSHTSKCSLLHTARTAASSPRTSHTTRDTAPSPQSAPAGGPHRPRQQHFPAPGTGSRGSFHAFHQVPARQTPGFRRRSHTTPRSHLHTARG